MFGLGGDSVFPMQVGPPTDYARSKSRILVAILLLQIALMITRCVFSFDIIGAIIMCIQIFTGYYAWQQDMNITYLCIFGMLCFVNGIYCLVMAIIPIGISTVTLQVGTVVTLFLLPLAHFAGAYLVHLIFKDWQDKQKQRGIYAPAPSAWTNFQAPTAGVFGLGSIFGSGENAPLKSSDSIFSGKGYTLGEMGQTDAFLTKAKAYSDQGMSQAQSGWNSATGAASGYAAQAQSGIGGFFNTASPPNTGTPAGRHDISYDPFITN